MTHSPPAGFRRLSHSCLWERQRSYFKESGIRAWQTGAVPHQVTSNPVLAAAYARVIQAFRHDNGVETIDVFELGAGSGQFSFHLLRALASNVRYTISDFVEANLDFCRNHEALKPFVAGGQLNFVHFDAEADDNHRIPDGPCVIIANYFFDGLPHDAFTIDHGTLHECWFGDPAESETESDDHPAWEWQTGPEVRRAYPDIDIDGPLREMISTVESGRLLVPVAALRLIERLNQKTGPLLLLTADRGYAHDVSATTIPQDLALARHGSISLPVNFPLLARYVRSRGGLVFEPAYTSGHLHVAAYFLPPQTDCPQTAEAFQETLGISGPDDVSTIRRNLKEFYAQLEPPALLAVVRQSRYDPWVLGHCIPFLWPHLDLASADLRNEIHAAAVACFKNYYHIGESYDFPFALGALAYAVKCWEGAITFFEASARFYGDCPETLWNLALCHLATNNPERALACLRRNEEWSPQFPHSKEMLRLKADTSEPQVS